MSFPRYPTYKPSGVEWLGEVPEHWEVKRIAALYSEVVEAGNEDLPVLSVSIHHGVSDSELSEEEMDRKVVRSEDRSKYKRVAPGDIVYNMMRAWQGAFGSVVVEGMVSPAYVVARPKTNLPTEWIEYLLRTEFAVNEIKRFSRGITDFRLRLYWDEFKNLRICAPPAQERASILRFLDHETAKIDALIAEQQRLIELLQEKRQAVISNAVTKGLNPDAPMKDSGVEWLGEVPEHWEVMGLTKTIGPVVDYRGRTPSKCDSGTLLVTARNIRSGEIDYSLSEEYVDPLEAEELLQRGRPVVGDVLFTMEAPLGQVALVDREDIALAQRVVKFRGITSRMTNNFLMWWLAGSHCQNQLSSLSTGSTALGIKASKLSAITCLVPPVEEQLTICNHIHNSIRRLSMIHDAALSQIALLQERRSALISAAVTGQIDVRGLVPEDEAA